MRLVSSRSAERDNSLTGLVRRARLLTIHLHTIAATNDRMEPRPRELVEQFEGLEDDIQELIRVVQLQLIRDSRQTLRVQTAAERVS